MQKINALNYFIANFWGKTLLSLKDMFNFLITVSKPVLLFGKKLVSFISQFISYLIEKLSKTKKIKLLLKIGKFIAFLVLFYQIISVTISYFKYETSIDMKAIENEEQRPTFTFCLKNVEKFDEKNLSLPYVNFDHLIGCFYFHKNHNFDKNPFVNCSKLTQIVKSLTPRSQQCFSYFSRLFDENFSPNHKIEFSFLIPNNVNAFGLIHQSATPPHLFEDKIEISKSSLNKIDYSSINTNLLPFPYATDCLDYKREEKSLIPYKSREDCIVKHLERRELSECGCNKRWSYRSVANSSNKCPKTVKCYLNLKQEKKFLEQICKKNCVNQYFLNIISSSTYLSIYEKVMIRYFNPSKIKKNEIIFTYLPKMNLVEYFCSIGSLISMWFGISVYDLTFIFFRETKRRIIYFRGLIGFEMKILMIPKLKNFISHKFNDIFSKLIIIVFSVLMLCQIITLIKTYFDYEIVTRFDVQELMSIPNIVIVKNSGNTLLMAKQLVNIYPEIRKKYRNQSEFLKSNDFEIYKRKLLSDNKMEDFHRIVGSEKLIRNCHLMIDNTVINFTKIDEGVTSYLNQLFLLNRLNYSSIDKYKIERITISLYDFDRLTVNLGLYDDHIYLFDPNKYHRTKVTFSSFLTQKLNTFQQNCINEKNNDDFGEEFCFSDCYFDETNKIYGCFPFIDVSVQVYFERDIKRNGYKFCNDLYVADFNLMSKINKICKTKCRPKCRFINFVYKREVSKHIANETILEFIPKKTPRIAYIETLKTDLNRLIYNCGGIFGLWFGLTPVKAVDLIQYSTKIFNILIVKITLYLIAIFKKCFTFITIFFRSIRSVFSNSSVFPIVSRTQN